MGETLSFSNELLDYAAQLGDVDFPRVADGDAVCTGDFTGQSGDGLPVQAPKNSPGPDVLIGGDCKSRNAARVAPLGQELTFRIEDFDAAIIAICNVDPVAGIDDDVVGQLKLAGTGSPLAPLQQILSVSRVFHPPGIAIAIANVHIAI